MWEGGREVWREGRGGVVSRVWEGSMARGGEEGVDLWWEMPATNRCSGAGRQQHTSKAPCCTPLLLNHPTHARLWHSSTDTHARLQ